MQILTRDIKKRIQQDIITNVLQNNHAQATKHVVDILKELYDCIPENKRISFGIVYTIQVLSKYLFSSLVELGANVFEISEELFERTEEFQTKGVTLGILSFYGITNYEKVIPFFEASAASANWDMR